jgi:hypothetical protein
METRASETLVKIDHTTLGKIPLGSGVYSTSDRNEYQKQKNNNVPGE